jgi:hypothetical protein
VQRPIFIVGTMRSGSTVFRLVIDSHPHIAIGEETGFMGALAATKAIPSWRFGKEWYGRLGWSEDELDARLREFYSGVFERFAAGQGKSRWGEKTPFHSWHIADMARIFPDAVFVAIVRHPGAVASSLRKRFHYEVREAAEYWANTNIEILRHAPALGAERFALVRYEDLVGDTEMTMRELLDWLGEPWSDDVIRHNEVQAAKGAPRVVDGNTNTRDPIDPDRAGHWTSALSAADRQILLSITNPLATFLGYTPSGAAPRTGDAYVLTGDVLAQRQHAHRDTISFAPRERDLVPADMTKVELAARLKQAETSLARIRARPVVRFSDAVRRAQRRFARSRAADLLAGAPRTAAASRSGASRSA